MSYQNRLPPEGINAQTGPWAGALLRRLLLAAAALALLGWLTLLGLAQLARWTPFSWEQSLTEPWTFSAGKTHLNSARAHQTHYLQQLAEQLAHSGGLNPRYPITVHVLPGKRVNAFATLGGNIVVFQGLLDKMPSEQALAFVLAHEIAHIQYRHPIQAIARQAGLSLLLAMVFGQSDLSVLAGSGSTVALLNYSRASEREADLWAYHALAQQYGHLGGSGALFKAVEHKPTPPAWLGSHPDIAERLNNRRQYAQQHAIPLTGKTTPLPDFLRGKNRQPSMRER